MPFVSSMKAPNVVVLTTLPVNSSPTSTSLVIDADAVDQGVALLAVGRVDADGAVVVDVDLGVELLGQRADRLAALADDHADLLGVDLDLVDRAERSFESSLARALDRLGHLAEDVRPCRPWPGRARRAGCRR